MKRRACLAFLAILVFMTILPDCKKKSSGEDQNANYSKGYQGSIILQYKRDFPPFDARTSLPVTVNSSGVLTSGASVSCPIVTEDTLYENGEPKLRMKLNGTMTFIEASGSTMTISGVLFMLVFVHSTLQYQVTVWAWDKQDQVWIQTVDAPFSYSDVYGNGTMQFNMTDAQLAGSYIGATLPDIEGTFTYGYTLFLIPNP